MSLGRVLSLSSCRLLTTTLFTGCLLLAGCAEDETQVGLAKAANEPDKPIVLAQAQPEAQTSAISPYLAPAPDVFEATGRARWDGKRTLQGIWVAHPQAETARRVRIFNTDNGRAADGALFKRDANDGQDSVLISSEAAMVLGISPGSSASIRIVAVTPVEQPIIATIPPSEPEEAATPVAETPDQEAAQPEDQPVAQPEAESEAAPETAAAPTLTVPETQPETQPAAQPEAPAETPAEAPAETLAEAPAEPPADTPTVVAASPANNSVEPEAQPQPEPQPETEVASTAASVAQQEEPSDEPSDEITFKWDRAPDTPPADDTPSTAAAPAPAPAAETPTPVATQPTASGLPRPFVQAGIFGVKSNATALIARLEKLGLPAQGRNLTMGGRQMTRVLAGPFETRAQRDAAQRTIRNLGLRDAVPVRR
ncbi:MAG: SPOR domain-containing protein [Pseudomonadota bacterium]